MTDRTTELPEHFRNRTSPLNEMDKLVFGVDAIRHPITGHPCGHTDRTSLQRPLTANEQARVLHLPMIRRDFGQAVHDCIKAELDEYERTHGEPEWPPLAKSHTKFR